MAIKLTILDEQLAAAQETVDDNSSKWLQPDYYIIAKAINESETLVAWAARAREELQRHGYCRCEPDTNFVRLDGTLAVETCPRCKLLEELIP